MVEALSGSRPASGVNAVSLSSQSPAAGIPAATVAAATGTRGPLAFTGTDLRLAMLAVIGLLMLGLSILATSRFVPTKR
ncbi:MAG: hypothetical protein NVSMB16_12060 [Acidimicrobiales bacterium]